MSTQYTDPAQLMMKSWEDFMNATVPKQSPDLMKASLKVAFIAGYSEAVQTIAASMSVHALTTINECVKQAGMHKPGEDSFTA